MKVIIKTKNLKLSQVFRQYIGERINSLEKFAKIFQDKEKYYNGFFGKGKPRVEVWIEIGKITLHYQKGAIFFAECQMRFPGRSLRATAQHADLKLAITEVKDKLQRELKQYKDKLVARREKSPRY